MDKIIAFFTVLFMFLPSYLMSFLPFNNDTVFDIAVSEEALLVDEKEAEYEKTSDGAGVLYSFGEMKTCMFNFYGIRYSSDAYMKGYITVKGRDNAVTEEFFLEPGDDVSFFSFTDSYLEKDKMNRLISVEVMPLDKAEADFTLHGVGLFNRKVLDNEVYIENDEHKLGVTLNWGGALSYLEDKDSRVEAVIRDGITRVDSDASSRYGLKAESRHVNLINAHDTGRLVQQSYYGTGDCEQYKGEYYGESLWNYNPVQGGNQYNEAAKIVDVRTDADSIYIKCRPLDWAKSKESIAPCYMEATYTLSDGLIKSSCRFVDFSGYPNAKTTQECPAFYCIEPLNRFVYYGGDKPWTDDKALSYENELIFWPDAGYPNFYATENWAAFIGEFDDSFGIGLYVEKDIPFLAGVFCRDQCTTEAPAAESPTSYIAAVDLYEFRSFSPTTYEFWLSTGDVTEIRNSFATLVK